MENVRKLLDKAKEVQGVESDYALAKSLGLPRERISNYYAGERMPNEYACLKIAEALGKPLSEVIAAVRVEGEKDEKRREAWRRYYKSLSGVAASFAAAMVLTCVMMIVTSNRAEAIPYRDAAANNLYYVKFLKEIRRAISWLRCRLNIVFGRVYSINWLNACITA